MIFYFDTIAEGIGYGISILILTGLLLHSLEFVIQYFARTKELNQEIRNLQGTIGDLRYKVAKYQRTKEYHKDEQEETDKIK